MAEESASQHRWYSLDYWHVVDGFRYIENKILLRDVNEFKIQSRKEPKSNNSCIWVWESLDMIQTPLWLISNSGTWMSILIPTHSRKIFIAWTTMSRIQTILYSIFFVSRYYLPEISSSVSPYLAQSRYRQACFTRTQFNVTSWLNSSTTCLQAV
jgi:hypothetical protein